MVGLLTAIQERFPQVSVILTSGLFRAPPAGFGRQLAFIPKPYILKVVVDVVIRAMKQKTGDMAPAREVEVLRSEMAGAPDDSRQPHHALVQ